MDCMLIGGIGYTEILQRKCGKERIYVDKKNNSASRKGEKVRIIVEHVYGTQDMEETFRPINEQNAVKNTVNLW